MLTPGQAHDLACAEPLIDRAEPQALIGDKAYDADPLIDTLSRRDITPVIPPKANRKIPRDCDFALYRERNLVERFFNKLKGTSNNGLVARAVGVSCIVESRRRAWVSSGSSMRRSG
jgi:transposase